MALFHLLACLEAIQAKHQAKHASDERLHSQPFYLPPATVEPVDDDDAITLPAGDDAYIFLGDAGQLMIERQDGSTYAAPAYPPAPAPYINEPLDGYVDQAVFDAALERNAELANIPYGWDVIEGDDQTFDAAIERAYQRQKGRTYR